MQEELLQFKRLNVWKLVKRPQDKRPIGTRWVYRNKKDGKGVIIRNKARLVVQGFSQREGLDYDECKKQVTVSTSTAEAEYIAASSCCSQVIWMQHQLLDYGLNFFNTPIKCDNEAAVCIVKNPVQHSKTKHIDIRMHFIRNCYDRKLVNIEKVHTDNNFADLFTKAFDRARFEFLVESLGMINFD